MTIFFHNRCGREVMLSLDGMESFCLRPYEEIPVERNTFDDITVSVSYCGESHVTEHKFKGPLYTLVIQTTYGFCNVADGEIFYITHEKIRVDPIIEYDRMFLRSASCLSDMDSVKSHKVYGEDLLKEKFKKDWRSSRRFELLIGPAFFTGIDMLVLGALTALLFGWKIGIKTAVIGFPVLYFLWIAIEYLVDRVWKKATKENEIARFEEHFTSEFIQDYFTDPHRKAYDGKMETD